ncbi:MAG: hypothetical protein B7Z77_07310 [Acidocella sp. 20-58-15]|nr:MAG: hypothetical protein B7Z77_07310 [Acidocella sp. 20-58-15]
MKINWNSKSDNILEICSEFNIKPKSVVFVDDNPIERAEVKSAIPDIRVIGSNPYLTKRILLWSSETQITFLSDESSRREEMIRSQIVRENQRTTLKKEDFLATLNTKLRLVEVVDVSQPEFSRALELTNKTNQFNTTGVRWNSEAVLKFLRDDGHIYAFSVKDKFADYGLVGVIYQKKEKILQFVMSCRVMGMDIEYAALLRVISKVRNEIGEGPIYADLIFTKENTPSRNLFSQCNFVAINENETVKNYCLHYQQETAFPGHIEIVD